MLRNKFTVESIFKEVEVFHNRYELLSICKKIHIEKTSDYDWQSRGRRFESDLLHFEALFAVFPKRGIAEIQRKSDLLHYITL